MAEWIKFFAWIFISGIIGATVSIVCNFLYDAFKKGGMTMRLIDAEALEESIEQIDWYHLARNGEMAKGATAENGWYKEQDIYNAIEEAPTIEAKPVVHAHWLEQIIDGGQELMCSNCGEYALMNDEFYSEFSKYCPCCGAQMDEKENDNG